MALTLSAAQCARAASAYRALLRAQRLTFKGDDFALQAAHQQTRILFNRFIPSASTTSSPFQPANPLLPPPELKPGEAELTSDQVDDHIAGAFEIAEFLRKNVVQGVRNAEGNFALRIHEETERGDNDTIKNMKNSKKPKDGVPPENQGVRRRRRRNAAAEAEQAAPSGCCGGGMA
ncbi:hypothetical protein JCM10207_004053 [Rhodosporidiobolus poonsookiae]